MDKYNWEAINYPLGKDAWKKCEKHKLMIALNVLYAKKQKIYPAYVSKHNTNLEKHIILLMILNGEGWNYLTVKKLSILLRLKMSKHDGNAYCLYRLYLLRTKNKLDSHKSVFENKGFCKDNRY